MDTDKLANEHFHSSHALRQHDTTSTGSSVDCNPSDLAMSQHITSNCSASAQCQSLLHRLPLELRIEIYKPVLSLDSKVNNASLVITIAQHKDRREPLQRTRLKIYKTPDIANSYSALLITCRKVYEEVMQYIIPKIIWRFDSADVLSCFLGTNCEFSLPAMSIRSRLELLLKVKKVEVLIPEWNLWDQAPVEPTRLGAQLHVPLSLTFVDQIYKGVENRGLIAVENCWSQFAMNNDMSAAEAEVQ